MMQNTSTQFNRSSKGHEIKHRSLKKDKYSLQNEQKNSPYLCTSVFPSIASFILSLIVKMLIITLLTFL